MGLRDRARRAAEERDRNDPNSPAKVKARVEQTRRDMIAALRAELAEWSERTGFPVKRTDKVVEIDMGVCVIFTTDDKIELLATRELRYDPSGDPTGVEFRVTYGPRLSRAINSVEDLGLAMREYDR